MKRTAFGQIVIADFGGLAAGQVSGHHRNAIGEQPRVIEAEIALVVIAEKAVLLPRADTRCNLLKYLGLGQIGGGHESLLDKSRGPDARLV
ncbi:hypothetical protein D9M68_903110 [compost metagenome]